MSDSRWLATGRASSHKKIASIPVYSWIFMDDNKHNTAHITLWATASAYEKQNDGEPGQTAGQSSHHYEGHRPDALQGTRWGDGRILLMFQTA